MLSDPSLNFIRDERNWILKEAPPRIGQIAYAGKRPLEASDLYYYDDGVPATDTIHQHIERTAEVVAEAEARFG